MTDSEVPAFVGPQGERGEDLLIVWDIQNVRVPADIPPDTILRYFYEQFVVRPGPRRCSGCYCTFTDSTKRAIGERRFNSLTSNGVLNCFMLNVPGGDRKPDDADHPLKEVMLNFTVDCLKASKNGVILLITGDADFVRPAVWCKQQGCVKLELLYYDPCAAFEIKKMHCSWSMEWRDFLDRMVGERRNWVFPYPDRSSDDDSSGTSSPTGHKHGKRNHHIQSNRYGKNRPGMMLRNPPKWGHNHAGVRHAPQQWNGHHHGTNYNRSDVPAAAPVQFGNGMVPVTAGNNLHMQLQSGNGMVPVTAGNNLHMQLQSGRQEHVPVLPASAAGPVVLVQPPPPKRTTFLQRLQQAAALGAEKANGSSVISVMNKDTSFGQSVRQPPIENLGVKVPATGMVLHSSAVPSSTSSPSSSPSAISSSDLDCPEDLATNLKRAAVCTPPPPLVPSRQSPLPMFNVASCQPKMLQAAPSHPAAVSPSPLQLASQSLQQLLGMRPPVTAACEATPVAIPVNTIKTSNSVHSASAGLLPPQFFQTSGQTFQTPSPSAAQSYRSAQAVSPTSSNATAMLQLLTPALAQAFVSGSATPVALSTSPPAGVAQGLLTPDLMKDPWVNEHHSAALLTPRHVAA